MWLALEPVAVPRWSGPSREFRLLDRAPTVPQPKVAREPWESKRNRRCGRPPKWRAWTLLVPGVNDAPLTAKQLAACWPLVRAA